MLSQNSQFTEYPVSQLRKHFQEKTSEMGLSLLQGLLTYDPKQRLSADAALKHGFFKELPLPIDPSMFPTWPAKSGIWTDCFDWTGSCSWSLQSEIADVAWATCIAHPR